MGGAEIAGGQERSVRKVQAVLFSWWYLFLTRLGPRRAIG